MSCHAKMTTRELTSRDVGRLFRFTLEDGRSLIGLLLHVAVSGMVTVEVRSNEHDWPEGWLVTIGSASVVCVCEES